MRDLLSLASLIILIVLIGKAALAALDSSTLACRRPPWGAAGLTALAVAAVLLQHFWSGALDTFDSDPHRAGWWRPVTAVFMQNSGVVGDLINIGSLAVFAAFAEWLWGRRAMLLLFLGGALAPRFMNGIFGAGGVSDNKRDWAGSSGATVFLGATTVLFVFSAVAATRGQRLTAVAIPPFGLLTWFTLNNAHGLVATDGFLIGGLCWVLFHRRLHAQHEVAARPHRAIAWLVNRRGSMQPRVPEPHAEIADR